MIAEIANIATERRRAAGRTVDSPALVDPRA
jgi:hypothetical protein